MLTARVHEGGVIGRQHSAFDHQSILEAGARVAAEGDRERQQRNVRTADRDDLPDSVGREHGNGADQRLGRRGHASADAHDDRELQWRLDQPLPRQRQRHVEMAGVVDLDLGLDAQLGHPRSQSTDSFGRIAKLAGAERHRAYV